MPTQKFVDVRVGDVVRLRRDHPCGGTDWTVVRLGADIGLTCETCHHRILLPRSQFERRLKQFVTQVPRGDELIVELPRAGHGGALEAATGEVSSAVEPAP